jgi:hypothetical protein
MGSISLGESTRGNPKNSESESINKSEYSK